MSEENEQLLEQMEELPFQNLKCLNQHTAISLKQKNTYQSAIFDTQFQGQSSTDWSFEKAIHQQNVQILKNATLKYLEQVINQPFNKNEGFKDQSLYQGNTFEPTTGNQLELITLHNLLLTEKERQQLFKLLKEEDELLGLFKQLALTFGVTIGKELVYIIFHVLKLKIESFKVMRAPKDLLLPRFNCFHGFDEEENVFTSECPIYEDLNLEQIPSFAQKDIDELCSQLYNSSSIRFFNLREIKYDKKCSAYPSRFNPLIKQISRTVFYSLAGSVEPTQCGSTLFVLDLTREVSFSDFPEGNILSVPRSYSRPFVSCDDEQMDFLSKKQKFE